MYQVVGSGTLMLLFVVMVEHPVSQGRYLTVDPGVRVRVCLVGKGNFSPRCWSTLGTGVVGTDAHVLWDPRDGEYTAVYLRK